MNICIHIHINYEYMIKINEKLAHLIHTWRFLQGVPKGVGGGRDLRKFL